MESILLHYLSEALYMLAGLAVGYLWRSLRVGHRDYGLIREGVCALLRDRLLQKLEKCEAGGYCSVEARDDIEHMFKIYTILGGNGTVKALWMRVRALPSDPPKGAKM